MFVFGCPRSSLPHMGCSLTLCELLRCGTRVRSPQASVVVEGGLSGCGLWTWLPPGVCRLSGAGVKPACPALAGEFLPTAPPGKASRLLKEVLSFLPCLLPLRAPPLLGLFCSFMFHASMPYPLTLTCSLTISEARRE